MADTARFTARSGASSAGSQRGRVLALDVARCLAIIGMVTVNVGPKDDSPGASLYLLPHGRASILFVLLAGIGFSLMTRRVRQRATGRRAMWGALAWRSGLLLVGGLALQLLDHQANVILPVYAFLFLLAGMLVRARDAVLLALAGAGVIAGPMLWLGVQLGRGNPFTGAAPELGDSPAQVLAGVVVTGPYPLITWVGPFALGMWLGRRTLTDMRVIRVMALTGGTVALVAVLAARVVGWVRGGPVGDLSWELLLTDAPHGQMPLWLIGGTAASALVLALCLAAERWLHRGPLRVLAPLGQLSLTFYVVHLLVLDWVRPWPHDPLQGVVLSAALVVGALAGAWLWRRYWSRGPLEMVLRAPWTWHGARA